jgi:plasmid maintenance system antidote protein VapI
MLNPVHPDRFLWTEIVQAQGLTATAAAKILQVSRPTLSSLPSAKADEIHVERYQPRPAA